MEAVAKSSKSGMTMTRRVKDPKYQIQDIQEAVRAELEPLAKAHARSRARVSSNWDHQPDFEGVVRVGPKVIEVQVQIKNKSARVNDSLDIGGLWALINAGSPAHRIEPRNEGGLLVFNWGGPGSYQSKTGANPARFGGPGQVRGGEIVAFPGLDHPGFPGRHFNEDINADLEPEFAKRVPRGVKKGFQRSKRR